MANLNAYRLLARTAVSRATMKDTAKATIISDFDSALSASQNIAPYQFEVSESAQKFFRTANEVEITQETTKGGTVVNRVSVVMPDGRAFSARLFGNKDAETLPAHKLTKEEISKAVWGICKSNGEIVPNTLRPSVNDKGELAYPPQWYLNIAKAS